MDDSGKFSSPSKFTGISPNERLKVLKQVELTGSIVIFDITDSTKLKQKRSFPNWIEDWNQINGIIQEEASKIGAQWSKFLGDAFLFFFLDSNCTEDLKEKHPLLTVATPSQVYNFCISVMESVWENFRDFRRKGRGTEKEPNFREITCAIDYGSEVLNWYSAIDDNFGGNKFDPIGPTIDRSFRISSITGPNQIICSSYYYDKLPPEIKRDKFIKFTIKEGTLKGFNGEKTIYYSIPSKEKIDYILSSENVDLVEDLKFLSVKEKIHLFRHERKTTEG